MLTRCKHLILALGEETNEIEDFWPDVLLAATQTPFHDKKWDVDEVEELGGSGVGEHSRLVSFNVNLHYSSSTTHQRQKVIKQNGACTRPVSTVCRVHSSLYTFQRRTTHVTVVDAKCV